MLLEIEKENHGCKLGFTKLSVKAYANDIVKYYPSVSGLRESLLKLGRLMNELELQINTGKSNVMILNGIRVS